MEMSMSNCGCERKKTVKESWKFNENKTNYEEDDQIFTKNQLKGRCLQRNTSTTHHQETHKSYLLSLNTKNILTHPMTEIEDVN
ncbi:CLUMA_CG017258, isoform A [Clunio marinus]|uniref:CLUMA_CG017258, isoform A n=1 Tax=Clunio marinus TaxID=568069 RepID=A0A1J1IV63_9DIPT|nr:CLUMA_CG017258, isoform A [Clunio marinus]